jgi:hypothetical protein
VGLEAEHCSFSSECEALCYTNLNPEKETFFFFSVYERKIVLVLRFRVDTKRVMEIFFLFSLDECRQNLEDCAVGFIFMS